MSTRFADTFYFFALENPDDPAHQNAREFASHDAGPLITTAWVLTELADGLSYVRRPDKAWSLTDCISFVVMTDRGLTEALTGDHHFEQARFHDLLRDA